MDKQSSIVVVGGGLVGLLSAISLSQQDISIVLLEKNIEEDILSHLDGVDRPISLNYQSYLLLKKIGVWSDIQSTVQPITDVHISEQGAYGVLRFSAEQCQIPVLGYVVSYKKLYKSLLTKCLKQCHVEFNCELQSISYQNNFIIAHCNHDRQFTASLLLGADGVHSKVRNVLAIDSHCIDKCKVAVSGLIKSSAGQPGVAYQRFTKQGIFAFLPGQVGRRLVWTMTDSDWQTVSQYDNDTLCKVIENVMATRFGKVTSVKLYKPMPLQRVSAVKQVENRAILLGNAAHTIYPIAAQGFNYSLQEVILLQQILQCQDDYGSDLVLQQFESAADKKRKELYKILNAIDYCFDYQLPCSSILRGKFLAMLDFIPGKLALAKKFLGLSTCDGQLIL